ncbi:MAG: hypothetical protein ACPGSM_14625 [Thiolinea sp.]
MAQPHDLVADSPTERRNLTIAHLLGGVGGAVMHTDRHDNEPCSPVD